MASSRHLVCTRRRGPCNGTAQLPTARDDATLHGPSHHGHSHVKSLCKSTHCCGKQYRHHPRLPPLWALRRHLSRGESSALDGANRSGRLGKGGAASSALATARFRMLSWLSARATGKREEGNVGKGESERQPHEPVVPKLNLSNRLLDAPDGASLSAPSAAPAARPATAPPRPGTGANHHRLD